ncbi:MAG: N-acetyltransferase [Cyclobacteriaceae bacterium]|nr:MAG: N-acetyltransferase [Cyclobacteriaceae bacterium]
MHTVLEGQKLLIKVACTKDSAALSRLGKETFEETYASYNNQASFKKYIKASFSKDATLKQLEDAGNFFLLAQLNKKSIGYAKLRENNKPFHDKTINAVELERIYVLKDYQGEGVGKNLLEDCLAFAKLRKYPVMWLGVWEQNLSALKFYQRQGFVVFGSHKFDLGGEEQNDYLMKKDM